MSVRTKLLLDTNVLSAIMRRDRGALSKARVYLDEYHRLSFSAITRYEILRGLKATQATRQVEAFDQFCRSSEVLYLTDEVIIKAADIYADLRTRGQLIGDADILIAATALIQGAGVVTNNQAHFERVKDLHVENWLK